MICSVKALNCSDKSPCSKNIETKPHSSDKRYYPEVIFFSLFVCLFFLGVEGLGGGFGGW